MLYYIILYHIISYHTISYYIVMSYYTLCHTIRPPHQPLGKATLHKLCIRIESIAIVNTINSHSYKYTAKHTNNYKFLKFVMNQYR